MKERIHLFAALVFLLIIFLCGCSQADTTYDSQDNSLGTVTTHGVVQEDEAEDENVEYISATGYENYYFVYDKTENAYGIFDRDSQQYILKPTIDELAPDTGGYPTAAEDGYPTVARKGEYYGYIDGEGNEIAGFRFAEAHSFIDGVAHIKINKAGVIDTTGRFVLDPQYDEISIYGKYNMLKWEEYSSRPSQKGLICAIQDGKAGMYDLNGQMLIDHLYLPEETWYFTETRIYAPAEMNGYGEWYIIYDYDGNSLMDTIPKGTPDYISLPNRSVHVASYTGKESELIFYRLFDNEFNLIYDDPCSYVSGFGAYGKAVIIPAPTMTRSWYHYEFNEDGLFVIDNLGNIIVELPEIPDWEDRFITGRGTFYRYEFEVSEGLVVAASKYSNNNRDYYIINLNTLEATKCADAWVYGNIVCVQDSNTGLYSLYDGDELIDSNCTGIKYGSFSIAGSDETPAGTQYEFDLYHGESSTRYSSKVIQPEGIVPAEQG